MLSLMAHFPPRWVALNERRCELEETRQEMVDSMESGENKYNKTDLDCLDYELTIVRNLFERENDKLLKECEEEEAMWEYKT